MDKFEIQETLGSRFKKIRQQLNLSQEEIAKKLGLTTQAISNVEKDKGGFSSTKIALLLNLNINLNYLFGGIGDPFLDKNGIDTKLDNIDAIFHEYLKQHKLEELPNLEGKSFMQDYAKLLVKAEMDKVTKEFDVRNILLEEVKNMLIDEGIIKKK